MTSTASAAPPPAIASFVATDPRQVDALVRVARVEHLQLEAGSLELHIDVLQLGDIRVERNRCRSTVRVSGTLAPDSLVIGAVFNPGKWTRFNESLMTHGSIPFYGPGAEIDGAGGEGFEYLGISFPWSRLESYVTVCEQLCPKSFRGGFTCSAHPQFTTALATWWTALEQTASQAPQGDLLAERFMAVLCEGRRAPATTPTAAGNTWNHRRRIVLTAEALMRAHLAQPITMLQLCQATGVSRRSLEYAFRDMVQESPKAYLRKLRLNMARRRLQGTILEWGTIRRVARECGFQHLGEFSRDYKQMFGELPKETGPGTAPASSVEPIG